MLSTDTENQNQEDQASVPVCSQLCNAYGLELTADQYRKSPSPPYTLQRVWNGRSSSFRQVSSRLPLYDQPGHEAHIQVESGTFPFYRCVEPAEVAEERRLLYVAMTRAQLFLVSSQKHQVQRPICKADAYRPCHTANSGWREETRKIGALANLLPLLRRPLL